MHHSDWCGHICKHHYHHHHLHLHHQHHQYYSTMSESLTTGTLLNSGEVPSLTSCPCESAQRFKTYLDRIYTQIHKRHNRLSISTKHVLSWQMLRKMCISLSPGHPKIIHSITETDYNLMALCKDLIFSHFSCTCPQKGCQVRCLQVAIESRWFCVACY